MTHLDPDIKDILNLICKHISDFENQWSERKSFNVLKRFFKIYINNFRGASELRHQLMIINNYFEAKSLIEKAIAEFEIPV